MPRWRIGRQVRALRRLHDWRQGDLGARIGVSRDTISRIENDRLDNVPAGTIQACVEALGARLRLEVQWQGERLSRLIDARHAALQNAFVLRLETCGWEPRVEVSFNHYGDRGRIDVLAFHARTRTLLVTEVKPDIDDAQETIGRLDVKVRLAPRIAHEAGWRPETTVPALVLEEGASPRRHVARHAGLFRRLALRGKAAKAWLRSPATPTSGLVVFLTPR